MNVVLDCTDLTDCELILDGTLGFRAATPLEVDIPLGMHTLTVPNGEEPSPTLSFELREIGEALGSTGEGVIVIAGSPPRVVVRGTEITIDARALTVREAWVNGLSPQSPAQEFRVRLLPAANHSLSHDYSVCYGGGHPRMLFGVNSSPVSGAQVYFDPKYNSIATGGGTNRLTLTGPRVLVNACALIGQAPNDLVLIRNTRSPDNSELWSVKVPFMLGLLPGIHTIEVPGGGQLPFTITDSGSLDFATVGPAHSNPGNATLTVTPTLTIL